MNVHHLPQLSSLHIAAGRGDLEKVKKLVNNKKKDVNIKDPGSGVSTLDSSFTTDDLNLC